MSDGADPAGPADPPRPSDDDPAVLAAGSGDVELAILSMSARSPDGEDAAYLEWHVLDHLPEQYRIDGVRHGQRWISTAACRDARVASEAPFDEVDHIVNYLFAPPSHATMAETLDVFFTLGNSLHHGGRMPLRLPRKHLAIYDLVAKSASSRALVGADVMPWRPARGVYVVVERTGGPVEVARGHALDGLVDIDGVAGLWSYRGTAGRHRRVDDADGLEVTICYLDGDPVAVAETVGEHLVTHWAEGSITPLLGAPFEIVEPWRWEHQL